ncbi:MAG TPA: AMP-binding protein, partial [Stellaceae bacterium]|nr:AMP-binding protein [Stellaceae bacterium]
EAAVSKHASSYIRVPAMFDLGRTLLATVERSPDALAIVDGGHRFTYAEWSREIGRIAGGLAALGLKRGDRLATVSQNRLDMASLHWACQFLGIAVTPLNWRVKAEEIDYCLGDSDARAVVFDAAAAAAVADSGRARGLPRIAFGDTEGGTCRFDELGDGSAALSPQAEAEDLSLLLYTSGTTGRPKGVPRRHRAERAAAVAHVAQNRYGRGERTLGVMPLYHTMGVRSLLAMALVDGAFISLPRFAAGEALRLIARERVTNLYLVPTLYHDLLADPDFAGSDVSSVRKLGFAGAAMPDGLLQRVAAAFRPDLFVNHYGSSEIYTFTIESRAAEKPGSAGKAGINQRIRVVTLDADSPERRAAIGEEGEIIADMASEEAFAGYWRRPDADAKAVRAGWYFTGDTGYVDTAGDLFVTGRVDDLIISGGENVSPGEIESIVSLHPLVAEVAVAGLPDERWGRIVTAFVKRAGPIEAAALDEWCRRSALADYKRPRRWVFVAEIPKSPVGKILRRQLVAGEYEGEATGP